jgi:hypothetical protein
MEKSCIHYYDHQATGSLRIEKTSKERNNKKKIHPTLINEVFQEYNFLRLFHTHLCVVLFIFFGVSGVFS